MCKFGALAGRNEITEPTEAPANVYLLHEGVVVHSTVCTRNDDGHTMEDARQVKVSDWCLGLAFNEPLVLISALVGGII